MLYINLIFNKVFKFYEYYKNYKKKKNNEKFSEWQLKKCMNIWDIVWIWKEKTETPKYPSSCALSRRKVSHS